MLCEELKKRDESDKNRPLGALRLAADAFFIDTSDMTIDEVVAICVEWCEQKGIMISR